jgi:SAM-dependent methyltransferase
MAGHERIAGVTNGSGFGAVADLYDEVRPGYPAVLGERLLEFHGWGRPPSHRDGRPRAIVEPAAGTGKATELLVTLGAPVTCIEPDPRMAAVLRAKFPDVPVVLSTFEEWTPPPGGVDMIACACGWHWLDETSRARRAHAALAPGGTLAIFRHRYAFADPAAGRAIDAAFRAADPGARDRTEPDYTAELGRFSRVRVEARTTHHDFPRERYLQLVQTFSPFRRRPPDRQAAVLASVGAAIDGLGGAVVLELRTTLVLARA